MNVRRATGQEDGISLKIVKSMMTGKIVPTVAGPDGSLEMDSESMEYFKEINWRMIQHNHAGIMHFDTCGLCVIEQALYGGRD